MLDSLDSFGAQQIEALLDEIKIFAQSGDSIEGTMDICAQGQFGVGLARAGFTVTFNPLGAKGADIKFEKNGVEHYADVRRLREDKALSDLLLNAFDEGEAIEYGDEQKAFNQVGSALASKSKQAPNLGGAKPPFFVFIMSGNSNTEPEEFDRKVREIESTAAGGGPQFADVSGAVFTASSSPMSTRPITVWTNPNADPQRQADPGIVDSLKFLNIAVQ